MEAQYRYVLKVAEELLQNACPQELFNKYEKLKQISLSKDEDTFNFKFSSPQSHHQLYASSQTASPLQHYQQLIIDLLFESSDLFLETLFHLTNDQSSLEDFPDKLTDFASSLKQQLSTLQHHSAAANNSHQKATVSFERLGANMLEALSETYAQIHQLKSNNIKAEEYINQLKEQQTNNFEEQTDFQQLQILQEKYQETCENLIERNEKINELTALLEDSQTNEDALRQQNEDMSMKINNLQKRIEEMKSEVMEANEKMQELGGRSNNQFHSLNNSNNNSKNNQIHQQNQSRLVCELQHFVGTFIEEFSEYRVKYTEAYQEFSKKTTNGVLSDERLSLLLFVAYLFNKFEGDNTWLVGRLSDVSAQNEALKKVDQQRNSLFSSNTSARSMNKDDNLPGKLRRAIQGAAEDIEQFKQSSNNLQDFLMEAANKDSQFAGFSARNNEDQEQEE